MSNSYYSINYHASSKSSKKKIYEQTGMILESGRFKVEASSMDNGIQMFKCTNGNNQMI